MERSLSPSRKRWNNLVRLFGYSSVRSSLGLRLSPSQLDKLESAAISILKENIVNKGVQDDSLLSLFSESIVTFPSK